MRILIHVRKSKINYFNVVLPLLQQQVLRLEVTVADAQLVQVLHAFEDLVEELGCIDVVHSIVSDNVIEKLASIGVLHYQVKLTFCLDYLVKLYHSRMTYFL